MVQREREGERIPESTAMEDRFVMALKVKKSPPPSPLPCAPLPLGYNCIQISNPRPRWW